jgi:hypothetical protein
MTSPSYPRAPTRKKRIKTTLVVCATVAGFPVAGYEVTPAGLLFYLGTKHTACLAPEKCGVDGCR